MTIKAVTTAQLESIRKTANDKGIGKDDFQTYGLDGGIIAKALDAIKTAATPVEKPKLLKFVTSAAMPAVEKFVAAQAFGEKNPAGIRFYLWDNFRTNFLGKTEENVPAVQIGFHTLTKGALDAPIRAELTPELEETSLAHLYELISKQAHGEDGPLLVNGYANIFYIKDVRGNLWAVRAGWGAGSRGWGVCAFSVTDPGEWDAGYRVVSRK